MIIEKLTIRDLNSVLKLLPEGKYDKNVSELIDDIKSEGFKYKVVDENGGLLAGFIANYTEEEEEEGYIVEVFNNKSFKGKKAVHLLVNKFNEEYKNVKHYFEIYPGSYWNPKLYAEYFKSEYVDMKLYLGNLSG